MSTQVSEKPEFKPKRFKRLFEMEKKKSAILREKLRDMNTIYTLGEERNKELRNRHETERELLRIVKVEIGEQRTEMINLKERVLDGLLTLLEKKA